MKKILFSGKYPQSTAVSALFILSVVMISLISCGSNSSSSGDRNKENEYVIGVSYQNLQTEMALNIQTAIRARAKELGVRLIEVDGMGSGERQVEQVQTFLTQGVNAIILQPIERDATAPAVEMANAHGTPIVVVNAMTANIEKADAYVGSEDVIAGRLSMQEMANRLSGKGNIVILHGPWGNSAQIERSEGIQEILKNYPDIKVVFEQTANWDRAQGLAVMENVLSSGRKVDAVISQNDEMAIGAYKAIEAANKQQEIIVSGVDAIPDAIHFVRDGRLACTVFQDGNGQGTKALDIAIGLAKGDTFPHDNFIPFELVTKENLDEFLAKHELK